MKKKVLITAAATNTGRTMAELFAANGWEVHITSRDRQKAETVAREIEQKYEGAVVYGYALEQEDVADIRKAFAEVRKNTDHLDALVCNAANLGMGYDIFNTDEAAYDHIMDVNVKGTFFVVREGAKLMTDGGSVVLIGSVQSKGAIEGRHIYGVSKAAIGAMSKYIAYDLAPYHIRCNVLVAGAIHTDRWDGIDDKTAAERRKPYPVGRESTMEEIAKGVYYLASDDSASVTGTELVIDSGVLMPILPYEKRKVYRHEEFEREIKEDQLKARESK